MIGLLGIKIGITTLFDKKNNSIPATIILNNNSFITNIRLIENTNYKAIQIGTVEIFRNNKKLTKSYLGHFIKNKLLPFNYLKEYLVDSNINYFIGQKITNNIFENQKIVNISGITIGKGFSGNIKKNNFKRGPESHGSKHHRLQGSIGAGTTPGRVFPGKKMSGRLGNKKCTIKNLEILDIDNNILVVKGNIPGKNGNLIQTNLIK
jgi:large subunit ribosomal protein L3